MPLSEEEYNKFERLDAIRQKRREKKKQNLDEYFQELKDQPCARERKMVMGCLNDTGYDRSQCELHFENYRNCKKFWNKVYWHRTFKRIKPRMPPPEEREAVMKEYMEKEGFWT